MKQKAFFLIALIPVLFQAYAQDPLFFNSNQSLVYLNPSFAGSNGLIRGQSLTRYYWPALAAPDVTMYTGVDAYIKPLHAGIAGSYVHDNAARGLVKSDQFSLSYAQYFSFLNNQLKIIPSVQAAYVNRNLDKTKLSYGDVYDPRLGRKWTGLTPLYDNRQGLDINTGLLINYKKFYFGVAVFHFNRPNIDFQELVGYSWPTRISVHTSYNFHPTEKSLLQAMVRYDNQQNLQYVSANLNALFNKHFIVGAGYRGNTGDNSLEENRWNADVNLNIGWRSNFFTLCVGYDKRYYKYPYSPGPGSWEVMMSINFRNRTNRRTITNFETW